MSEEVIEMPTNFRWSFSQWESYNSCPARWKYQSVLKLPRLPPGPAAARGLDLHDRVERTITGELPMEQLLKADPTKRFGDKKQAVIAPKYVEVVQSFIDHPNGDRYAERKMAFDAGFYLCSPKSEHAACIAVIDAAKYTRPHYTEVGVLDIAEWKSGSPKDTHKQQRELYALFGLRTWLPNVVNVTTYYLEHEDVKPERLVVKDTAEQKLKMIWRDRAAQMAADEVCGPRPGNHCNWCDYAKRKGGPCKFGS
jgi:hypothetical protein